MFTKFDLKTGMFVKLRDERIGMIIEDNIIINKGGFLRLTAYNESLCLVFPSKNSKLDIIEVRDIGKYGYDFNMFDSMDLKYVAYKQQIFNKSDIQDGDIIITQKYHKNNFIREYSYCKIHNFLLPLNSEYEAISFNDIQNDLTLKSFNEEVIFQIYRVKNANQYNTLSTESLVYERRE